MPSGLNTKPSAGPQPPAKDSASRLGPDYQVAHIPEVGDPATSDGAGADTATLTWAPLASEAESTNGRPLNPSAEGERALGSSEPTPAQSTGDDAGQRAAFLRRWSAAELQERALRALWEQKGDVAAAEAAMLEVQRDAGSRQLTLQQDACLGATLTCAIIEHRKDMWRAQRALARSGVSVSVGELQRFYYAHFRRSAEAKLLSAAMKAEAEEDGLDDYCAMCGQRGLLVACDACSNVYHLECVGLKEVPEGEWKCPHCVRPAPLPAAPPAAAASKAKAAVRPAPAASAIRPSVPLRPRRWT